MAENLGVQKVFVVANKVRGPEDNKFIQEHISGPIIGSIAFSHAIMEADMQGASPCSYSGETVNEVRDIKIKIEMSLNPVQ